MTTRDIGVAPDSLERHFRTTEDPALRARRARMAEGEYARRSRVVERVNASVAREQALDGLRAVQRGRLLKPPGKR